MIPNFEVWLKLCSHSLGKAKWVEKKNPKRDKVSIYFRRKWNAKVK